MTNKWKLLVNISEKYRQMYVCLCGKIAAQLDIASSILGRIERNEIKANKELIAKMATNYNQ